MSTGRPPADSLQETVEVLNTPGGLQFHTAVRSVAHRSRNVKAGGLFAHEVAKANSLNAPLDAY